MPLLTDARTGIARDGCYGAFTNDCDGKLTNEHWLSKGVLLAAGDSQPVRISGLSWQTGHEVSLSAEALGSNILCDRHNRALSRLDTTALRVFSALRRYQRAQLIRPDPHGNEFYLGSGEELERWLLKLFWGATAAGVIAREGHRITELRTTADREMLADYLFRDGSLPDGWGMYVEGVPHIEINAEAEIAVASRTGPDGDLWRGSAAMGVVAFDFCFGVPDAASERVLMLRPDGVVLEERGQSVAKTGDVQKVLALAWDRAAGRTFTLTFRGSRSVQATGN
jgi:hypothetical protein